MPESPSHIALKQLFVTKLKAWYGASIHEYPSSGHELDVFAVTSTGVSVYIEIIWSPSGTQFLRDMNMLQQSDAAVKLAVVHPDIIADSEKVREFRKIVLAQRKQGIMIHGDLLNGQKILKDSEYVDYDLRNLTEQLVTQAQTRPSESEKLSERRIQVGNPKCPICGREMRRAEVERPALHSGIYDSKKPGRKWGWRCDNCGMDFTENEL